MAGFQKENTFMEFVKKYEVKYKWLASVPNAAQAACLIEKIK